MILIRPLIRAFLPIFWLFQRAYILKNRPPELGDGLFLVLRLTAQPQAFDKVLITTCIFFLEVIKLRAT